MREVNVTGGCGARQGVCTLWESVEKKGPVVLPLYFNLLLPERSPTENVLCV